MYSSATIADYFIYKGSHEKIRLTPMQLLKLVYIAHGWYLGNHGKPLIYDEIQAWHFGPVIPVLYRMIKHNGPKPLKTFVRSPDRAGKEELLPNDVQHFLNLVWKEYRNYSGSELSRLTHQPGAPWAQARKKHPYAQYNVPISNEIIQAYYRAKVEQARREVAHG